MTLQCLLYLSNRIRREKLPPVVRVASSKLTTLTVFPKQKVVRGGVKSVRIEYGDSTILVQT
jgi:hypothetical protein